MRTFAVNPAFELTSVKCSVSGAISRKAFRRSFIFQHGGGGDDLEYGAWRELRLDGAVQKRRLGIIVELFPLFVGNANSEVVGIRSRMAGHRQNFARTRVQRDDGAGARSQRLLRCLLQVVIDGELNLFAWYGFLRGQ